MGRTRRARAELTESWDDVEGNSSEESYEEEEEGEEDEEVTPKRHETRRGGSKTYKEPELVMPSPNTTNGKSRTKTPHFRLNERSMTSDAGQLRPVKREERAQTPRMRMNDRSFTSDAGRFGRKASAARVYVDDPEDEDDSPTNYLRLMFFRIISPVLKYIGDVVGLVLKNVKPILSWLILAYLLVAALIFASGFVTNSITTALSPICRIPGVQTFFNPPFCPRFTAPEIAGPVEFEKLVQAQSSFDEVLTASSAGVNLPLDMKRSEAGIRDLRHVVEYSNLPSKNELVYEFSGFIDMARQASSDLSKFNSHIGRAVDKILSINRWTLNVIDGVSSDEAGRGSISRFFSDYLNVFAPFQPISLSRDVLLDQYLRHTSEVEDQILRLISEAHALLNVLENLDGRLDVIAGIATRDGLKAQGDRDELFAYLWTKLGGNRNSVKKLESQISVLNDVGQYRRIAWAHVTNTIIKLQSIRDNLEDLRERVAMPETVGTDKVPLEVHIDAITLGVQRLEEQRDKSRRLEEEAYRRVLSKAESGDRNMIGGREL